MLKRFLVPLAVAALSLWLVAVSAADRPMWVITFTKPHGHKQIAADLFCGSRSEARERALVIIQGGGLGPRFVTHIHRYTGDKPCP